MTRLFPPKLDNAYPGRKIALWLLGLLIALKLIIATNSMINTAQVAAGADGFPLDRYGPDGARAVLMLFAAASPAQVALGLFGVLALVRYRAMVPLVYLLFGVEFVLRRFVIEGYAIERAGNSQAPLIVNATMAVLLVLGLALSLWPRRA